MSKINNTNRRKLLPARTFLLQGVGDGRSNKKELKLAVAKHDLVTGMGYFARAHEKVYVYVGRNVSIYSTLTKKKIGEYTTKNFEEKFRIIE